jgi:hypothetical protein
MATKAMIDYMNMLAHRMRLKDQAADLLHEAERLDTQAGKQVSWVAILRRASPRARP